MDVRRRGTCSSGSPMSYRSGSGVARMAVMPRQGTPQRPPYRRNHDQIGNYLDFYDANIYDACMVLGLSAIKADSVNASQVREVLPAVSENYNGLTGSCGLDENGDRRVFHAGLYGIGYDPNLRWMLYGYYDSPENRITWDQSSFD
jgi:hypothetical protein